MFGATNIVKNNVKENYVRSGYRIAFDWKSDWNFGNIFARNIVLGVDNSSPFPTENLKNNFWNLGEKDTFGINHKFGASEKKIDINFSKRKTKFCLNLHDNSDNSSLFVNRKEICQFKASN